MPSSSSLLSKSEFQKLIPELRKQLKTALEQELKDCSGDPSTDLWDLPTVDSKTVCKLSPVLQSAIGHSLDPSWIRKGGYESVRDAVEHVIAQAQEHCVGTVTIDIAKTSKASATV